MTKPRRYSVQDNDNDPGKEPDMDDDDVQKVHGAFRRAAKEHGAAEHPHDLGPNNPAVSARQQHFMGAELNRAEHGKPTRTKMSEAQLRDFARKPKGGF